MDVFLLAASPYHCGPHNFTVGLRAENIASRVDGILKEPLEDWDVPPGVVSLDLNRKRKLMI